MITTREKLKTAVAIVPQTRLILQEFLALIVGIKPVINFSLYPNEIKLVKKNFPDLHIICQDKTIWNRSINICSISYNKSLARKTTEVFCGHTNRSNLMGELLGYPKCCVTKWQNYVRADQNQNAPLVVYQTCKATSKFSPFTNNLLNFSARVGTKDTKDFIRCGPLNRHLAIPFHFYQFISHVPCRYDCPESIKMGKEIDSLMREYAPGMEKVIKYTLSKPVLFFDLFKLVIFDGYIKTGVLHYKKIIPPNFLVSKSMLEKLKVGNNLIVNDKQIKILKDDIVLFIYKKKNEADGLILDFGEK
ncbi:MAG: hypothetical protein NTX26_00625 [Candidatus Parcubacteria bacterium]|nr:hypothetical protein [Candidatus Parcubacteria bacterium]